MTLTAERRTTPGTDGRSYPWTSGMVSTGRDSWDATPRHTFTYGYFAAAVKFPAQTGMFGAFWLMRPWLSSVTPPGDGHPVLVLPGLLADDASTATLRGFLSSHGYAAHGWNQGRNFGLRANLERDMLARIDELFERCGRRRISLVGWSLGGLYARHLAKIVPDKVRCIISLGSPFAGSPKSTNAWRTYEIVSGSKVEDQDPLDTLVEAPPVPTTSSETLLSRCSTTRQPSDSTRSSSACAGLA